MFPCPDLVVEISSHFFGLQFTKTHRFSLMKKVSLELFSLCLHLFLFPKMMKFYKAIFSAWISTTSAKNHHYFFSQKHNRNIFDQMKCTSMDFFRLLAFDRNPTYFIPLFLKNFIDIIYQYCYQLLMLLFGKISPGAIINHHFKIQFLGLEKDLTIWMFTAWESLFSYHISESSILWHIYS